MPDDISMTAEINVTFDTSQLLLDTKKEYKARVRKAGKIFVKALRADVKKKGISPPGSPPGYQSKEYMKSIRVAVKKSGVAFAGPTAKSKNRPHPLAAILEYGSEKMAARPHIRPTFDRVSAQMNAVLESPLPGDLA